MNFSSDDSSSQYPILMKEGDLILVYERHDTLDHFYIQRGQIHNNKFGAFHHNDFIGKHFGCKVYSRDSQRWVYALKPTPELWSLALHTRTQIVDEVDCSVISFYLDIFPGCSVVESGTGSGCMTLSLARAVAPTGRIHTFEYNQSRADQSRAEFKKLGVDHLITVTCRDVCGKTAGSGGFEGVASHSVDAVFLDLPEPWLAIDDAIRVLQPGKILCCYSPCAEQVMKTHEKLRERNFHSIKMIEVRQRQYDGRAIELELPDVGRVAKGPVEQEPSSKRIKIEEDGLQTPRINEASKAHRCNVARSLPVMKGHTAFLTFANCPVECESDYAVSVFASN